jgi:MFS family permease
MKTWPSSGLWRHPDFLKLWGAETVSQVGTQVSGLAIPLAAIIVLHASAFEVASLMTVEFLPFLLFALPAGVWVDRVARRPLMIVADLGRAVALASLPAVYALGGLTIWQLYGVGFAVGTLTVFFDVAYQSYLPALVDREQLVDGNAKLETSRSAAQMAGPGLGGGLVGLATAPYAILVDAISFLGSALAIISIRVREPAREPGPAPSMRRELWEGLRYVFGHRYWRPMAICTATSNFFGQIAWSIILVYAVRRLHLSPELIGLVLTLGSIGAVIGAVTASRIAARFGVGPTILAATLLFGPPMILVPLAPASSPLPFLIPCMMLLTFGGVLYNVTGISLIQTLTPPRLLGRQNASRRFVVWGAIPLGAFLGGVLASRIGLRPTIFVGAIGSLFAFLPVALSPIRSIRAMPEPEEAVLIAGAGVAADGHPVLTDA